MERKKAQSPKAGRVVELVEALQRRFVDRLELAAEGLGSDDWFDRIEWFRDEGRHGGGVRYAVAESPIFNRGSVNVSSVHYDDMPNKKLRSATALSSIIHPRNPRAPSFHAHISWTEMRNGSGYWRLMADLNPAIEDPEATKLFDETLQSVAPEHYEDGRRQGEAYFYIPVAQRHRGVSHFYLERYSSGNFDTDLQYARAFAEAVIDRYVELMAQAIAAHPTTSAADAAEQLAYHSLYLLQVLTLDRGTTSGILVHDQNDVGILGSLPAYVDRARVASWVDAQPGPQAELLQNIVDSLPDTHPSPVTDHVRGFLARIIRAHYETHPEALDLQASGGILPPTVENHSTID